MVKKKNESENLNQQPKKSINNSKEIEKEVITPEKVESKNPQELTNNIIESKKQFKLNKKAIIFISFLIFSVVFIIFSINAIGLFVKKNTEYELPFVYMAEGKVKYINSRQKHAITLGNDESASMIDDIEYSNKNDKYFLYTVNKNLYLANTRNKKESTKIASNVELFEFSEDDKYIVYTDINDDLYSYNGKTTEKLDTSVTLIVEVTNDKVLYKKEDSLFIRNFKKNTEDKVKITSDYETVTFNEAKTKILYSKETTEDTYEYHVYNLKNKKDEKILEGVYLIYDYNDDFNEFIYSATNDRNSINLNDFLDDDKKTDDENFKSYSFDDYWSNNISYDTYKNSQKETDKVSSRNSIRESLKNEDNQKYEVSPSLDIYYQKNSKQTKLAENITKVSYANLKTRRLVYTKDDYSSIDKIKISEISSVADIKNHIKTNLKNSVMYKAPDLDEIKITSDKKLVLATILDDELFCEADGGVFYAKLNKNQLTSVKSIVENVEIVDWENLYKDGLIAITNPGDSSGELKHIKSDKVTTLDNNVYNEDIVITYNKVYYLKDYNNNHGNYYFYEKKPKKIMDDVYKVFYLRDDYMYALKDYKGLNSTYDLYRYKNKKLEVIDYGLKDINFSLK